MDETKLMEEKEEDPSERKEERDLNKSLPRDPAYLDKLYFLVNEWKENRAR